MTTTWGSGRGRRRKQPPVESVHECDPLHWSSPILLYHLLATFFFSQYPRCLNTSVKSILDVTKKHTPQQIWGQNLGGEKQYLSKHDDHDGRAKKKPKSHCHQRREIIVFKPPETTDGHLFLSFFCCVLITDMKSQDVLWVTTKNIKRGNGMEDYNVSLSSFDLSSEEREGMRMISCLSSSSSGEKKKVPMKSCGLWKKNTQNHTEDTENVVV